ncbi:vitamin K epoxide reductase family protein [Candidatus Nitrospira allomarina]|uniref:Vitamin K epoxide reductase family protein n=1 Tax=Candidatus Nitrospira allomarina TaxID=3020900 RepID=A0AA96GGR8_9BACT|nr:vitamin K epoxide reductase family protein [Candidatus Nitrospira allomarina]WNM59810.1 vitamin K epoxide reductase family protein [Candidatus Nitrospira allomarina]
MAKSKRQTQSVGPETARKPSNAPSSMFSGSKALLDLLIIILAGAGLVLTAYLTYMASFEVHPAFCSEGSGCDIVQSSRWATFLGIPMALWGFVTYVVIAGLAWLGRGKSGSGSVLIYVAMSGFAVSAYLTIISVVEIEATCPYCLTSFAIITIILGLALARRPPDWTKSLKEAVVIGLVLVGGLHLHYSGVFDAAAGPEDPQLQALAIHLNETGAKFYGAYWCPRCQEQKAEFLSSAKRLPYVECSSGGRGSALTAPCVKADIKSYPTWIIGDRRLTGLKTPQELARASGFDWQE